MSNTKKAKVETRVLEVSRRGAPEGKKIGDVPKTLKFTLSFGFHPSKPWPEILGVMTEVMTGKRKPLTAEELERLMQAKRADIKKFRSMAKKAGLKVHRRKRDDRVAGRVRVEGTQAQIRRIITNFEAWIYEDEKGKRHTAREGAYEILADMPKSLMYIAGADDRDVAKSRARFAPLDATQKLSFPAVTSRGLALMKGIPVDDLLKQRKRVRASLFISLGGAVGDNAKPDLQAACDHDGTQMPKIKIVPVDGSAPDGELDDEASVENLLDFLAHFAFNDIIGVLKGDNNDDAFAMCAELVSTLVFEIDGVIYEIGCVTISWGSPLSQGTLQSRQRWARAVVAMRLRGMSIITAATGDNGSRDKTASAVNDDPSSIPFVFGLSGLRFVSTDGKTISARYGWEDSGGGIDDHFEPVSEIEKAFNFIHAVTMLNLHANALFSEGGDPASGTLVWYKGRAGRVAGTSHAAPFGGAELNLLNCLLLNAIVDMYAFIEAHAPEGMFNRLSGTSSNGDYTQTPDQLRGIPYGYGDLNFKRAYELASHYQDGKALPEAVSAGVVSPCYAGLLEAARSSWKGTATQPIAGCA